LRILRDSTRQLPVEENAYLHLADAAQRLGRAAEARRALLSYITLTDDDRQIAASASRIAELSLRLRDAPAAVRWLSRAIRLHPDDAMLHARLAEAHLAAGDPNTARQALDLALAHGADETTPLLRQLASQLEKP
jgi:predicted Zn-dependent protease